MRWLHQLYRSQNRSVLIAKPVHSGWPASDDWGPDLLPHRELLGKARNPREMCCYVYEPAISPFGAALLENRPMHLEKLVDWSQRQLQNPHDVALFEGIGGVCCPLGPGWTYAEYLEQLGGKILLVVGLRLGCLNHAILSLRALQAIGCEPAALVLNDISPADKDEAVITLARRELEAHCDRPLFGPLQMNDESGNLKILSECLPSLE